MSEPEGINVPASVHARPCPSTVTPAGPVREHPGRRPRWRLAATAAAALAIVTLAGPAAAAGTPSGNGTFGISPSASGSGRSAAYFTMTLAAGGTATATVVVANHGNATEKLQLSRSTGTTAGNGGSAFSGAFHPCSGAGCWVTGLPATVTLRPQTAEGLAFTVHVPPGTRPGQYLAGITGELAGPPASVRVGSNGRAGARAIVKQQITVAVAVTVGQLSQLTTQLRIARVFGSAIEQLSRLNVVLANTGQTFTRAAGQASCAVGGKRRTYQVTASTVLPGDQATIPANAIGLPQGSAVSCTVRLSYGRGHVVTWDGQVTIPAGPHVRLIHTGPGAYAAIPDRGIPSWAIALIAVGALLLVGVVGLLVIRIRSIRRTADEASDRHSHVDIEKLPSGGS
jgi:hypothetical protein